MGKKKENNTIKYFTKVHLIKGLHINWNTLDSIFSQSEHQ